MFGALNSFFTFKLLFPSHTGGKVNSSESKGKRGKISHLFADVDETIINVYSPVSKPESAIV